jgi:Mg-chelatase subunit ChlD
MKFEIRFMKRITAVSLIALFIFTFAIPPGKAKGEVLPDSNCDKAIEWLTKNQNLDGSWGKIAESKFLDTTEVARLLKENNLGSSNLINAQNFLQNLNTSNYDLMARVLPLISEPNKKLAILAALAEGQNEDGGWGISKGFESDPLDTVLIINAFLSEEQPNYDVITKGVRYLLGSQRLSGAWAYNEGAEDSVLLTAQAALCINEFVIKTSTPINDTYTSLRKSGDFLISKKLTDGTWGIDEESLPGTLVAYRAVINTLGLQEVSDLDTAIKNLQDTTTGSWYQNSYITALAVKALQERLDMPAGSINGITLWKNENESDIETYSFNAYENIKINAQSDFNSAEAKLVILIKQPDGTIVSSQNDGQPSWNTRNSMPGEYHVVAQIKENNKGRIIASEVKAFTIVPSFKIPSVVISKDPQYTTVGKAVSVKADATIVNEANIDKQIDVKLSVYDGESLITSSSNMLQVKASEQTAVVAPVGFTSDVSTEKDYLIKAEVYDGQSKISEGQSSFKVQPPPPPTRIDASQSLDKNMLYPGTDSVNAALKLSGQGTPGGTVRKPVDLVLTIDDSGSMEWGNVDWSTTRPWRIDMAKDASKHIIDLLQDGDRGAVVEFAGNVWTQQNLTGDKELLKSRIDATPPSPWNGTLIGYALQRTISLLDTGSTVDREKAIILVSDGGDTVWSNYSIINQAKIANAKGYKIHTIGLGQGADQNLLRAIANETGGNYVYSPTMEELDKMMGELAGKIFDTAGKDVVLETTIPKSAMTVEPGKVVPAPSSTVQNSDGSTTMRWNYDQIIMGQEKNIQISYESKDLISDTTIILTKGTRLTYNDSNNTPVIVDLADMSIPVNKYMLDTTITADRQQYGAGENVSLSVSSTNVTTNITALTGKIEIYDLNNKLVSTVSQDAAVTWQPGEIQSLNYTWNTENTMAGGYKARITWSEGGKVVSTAEGTFEIVSNGGLTTVVTSDKQSYNSNEAVNILVKVDNTSTNTIARDLTVKTRVQNAEGLVVWNSDSVVKEIYQNGEAKASYGWNTERNVPGRYTIIVEVYKGDSLVNQAAQEVDIISSAESLAGVSSDFRVVTKDIYPTGDTQFNYTITNNGNAAVEGLTVRARVIDISTEQPVGMVAESVSIGIGATVAGTLTWSHEALKIGTYLVVFDAVQPNGNIIPLGSGNLNVLKPYETTINKVVRPRILVWAESQGNIDLAKKTLDNMGTYYKTVGTREEFMAELRTGKYNLYMLLDTKAPLMGEDDVLLMNQIAAGKGIVATGEALLDNFKTLDVFGVKYRGLVEGTDFNISFGEGSSFETGTLSGYERVVFLELLNGTQQAQMSSRRGISPGAVYNQYQNGKSMLFAFDLEDCTQDTEGVLKRAVELTAPVMELDNSLVELEIKVAAKDSVDSQLKLLIPSGAELLWTLPAQDPILGRWNFMTERDKEYTLRALVKLPADPGEYHFGVESSYSVLQQSLKFDTKDLSIIKQ